MGHTNASGGWRYSLSGQCSLVSEDGPISEEPPSGAVRISAYGPVPHPAERGNPYTGPAHVCTFLSAALTGSPTPAPAAPTDHPRGELLAPVRQSWPLAGNRHNRTSSANPSAPIISAIPNRTHTTHQLRQATPEPQRETRHNQQLKPQRHQEIKHHIGKHNTPQIETSPRLCAQRTTNQPPTLVGNPLHYHYMLCF